MTYKWYVVTRGKYLPHTTPLSTPLSLSTSLPPSVDQQAVEGDAARDVAANFIERWVRNAISFFKFFSIIDKSSSSLCILESSSGCGQGLIITLFDTQDIGTQVIFSMAHRGGSNGVPGVAISV